MVRIALGSIPSRIIDQFYGLLLRAFVPVLYVLLKPGILVAFWQESLPFFS